MSGYKGMHTLHFGVNHSNRVLVCPQYGCGESYIAKLVFVPDTGFGNSSKDAILNVIKNIRKTADDLETAVNQSMV